MVAPRIDSVVVGESHGSGCCGEVFPASAGDQSLILKQFNSMCVDRHFLDRNFRRWQAMPLYEGIPELFDFRTDATPYCSLTEDVEGERLEALLGTREADCWKIIRELADILGHAHKHGVIHGHLHPGNIVVARDETQKKKSRQALGKVSVRDFGTGLVGEIHHIDLRESTYFLAPEQVEEDGKNWGEGYAQRWDVYSFGVIAFWLINERIPRGQSYIKERDKELARSGGRPVPVDPGLFVAHVEDAPRYSWGMSFAKHREHSLFREIIDECLSLDPEKRPVDMREVRNRFRALDHQFALEHAEDRVVRERLKQKGKLLGARALAVCLGVSFLLSSFYLIDYLRKTYFFQNKVSELDQVVLTQKATIDHLDERWAETESDLKKSREAADSFFQKMAAGSRGNGGVASMDRDDLEESRDYYLKTLQDVGNEEETALERARALNSLAHIERKLGINDKAVEHFESAIEEFHDILGQGVEDEELLFDIHLRLADAHETMAELSENPIGSPALASLREAVKHFNKVLAIKPQDQNLITRQAGTSFLLGRALDAHENFEDAIASYSHSADLATSLLEESSEGSDQLVELIGKLQFSVASALRHAGRIDESIDAHIASMETIERLRHVNGFTPLQSIQLASSFLELGELFATKEATDEDLDQLYNESLRLLTPLNTNNPGDVEVAVLLCRSLVHLGTIEREAGQWTAGYRLSVQGIEALRVALESEPDHVEGLLMIAEARLRHLEFLDREPESALKIAEKGIECIEHAREVLDRAGEAEAEKARRIYEPILSQLNVRLGETFQRYGDVCKNLGDNDGATRCYDQASIRLAMRSDDAVLAE